MIDEDELDEVEEGLVDLAMRGWRTLDEHPLDPRSKRVQLEHNELSTLPKTIGTLEFMWNCLLYTSPSPRDGLLSRMPSSA